MVIFINFPKYSPSYRQDQENIGSQENNFNIVIKNYFVLGVKLVNFMFKDLGKKCTFNFMCITLKNVDYGGFFFLIILESKLLS